MALEDYKDIVATVASVTTILQFFSGMFVCRDIKCKGSSKEDSVIPFLGGCVIGGLNLQYGILLGDPAMLVVNIVGLVFNVGYLWFYYTYSPCKGEVKQSIVQGAVFLASLLGYAWWEEPTEVEHRFGAIVTLLMLVLLSSPLLSLGEVLRTKSTASLPFPIILASTVVTFEWLLYGIIIQNPFLQVQNGVGFALCSIQLALFLIFPRTPTKNSQGTKIKKIN